MIINYSSTYKGTIQLSESYVAPKLRKSRTNIMGVRFSRIPSQFNLKEIDQENRKESFEEGTNEAGESKLLSSRRASVKARESYNLDRQTYFNNFKLSKAVKVDTEFKPNFTQIVGKGRESKFAHLKKSIEFKKVKDIFPKSRFIYNTEKQDDFTIFPGYFKPHALVIVMYLLNENRKLLKRIFLKQIIDNENSIYSVNLFLCNKWKSIQVDDFLPLVNKKIAFTTSNKKEAWVCLLEKAIAKEMGCYFETNGLKNLENLIRICSGCFTKKYYFMRDLNDNALREYLSFWIDIMSVGHIICFKTKNSIQVKYGENQLLKQDT